MSRRPRLKLLEKLHPVRGHEGFLNQCLSNLLFNAVKFVKPGGAPEIRISTESDGKSVVIWVADNGVGIAPENHFANL